MEGSLSGADGEMESLGGGERRRKKKGSMVWKILVSRTHGDDKLSLSEGDHY